MADIGSLGALTYNMTFPQQGETQQGYVQPPPAEVELPQYGNDPLASREKLTSDYYNNMGLLRSFAQDMAKKGINVFEPDYSQDGGGLAFQTQQKLQANLMYAANALGNEQKAEQQMRPYLAQGQTRLAPGVDPNQGMAYSDPNSFIPTRLPAGVEETNQRLAQETNDPQSQERANQLLNTQIQKLDNQVAQGLMRPEEAEYYKQQLVPNAWRTQPFSPRSGIKPEEIQGRAELIRRAKQGILSNDQTALNMFKLAPGIEDVSYVNTGDRVGIEVWHKGQPAPSFIDLSQGSGEGEINALLNRVEGQKNIPNESVLTFDTKVDIPKSNVGQILTDVKEKVKQFTPDTITKIQELAVAGKLTTTTGEPIASVEISGPYLGFLGKTELVVKHFKVTNGKVDYSKTVEKEISDPAELDQFIQTNANQLAPAFGGGFETSSESPAVKTIKSSDISAKASAAGYTPEEYTQLLQERGIQIVN